MVSYYVQAKNKIALNLSSVIKDSVAKMSAVEEQVYNSKKLSTSDPIMTLAHEAYQQISKHLSDDTLSHPKSYLDLYDHKDATAPIIAELNHLQHLFYDLERYGARADRKEQAEFDRLYTTAMHDTDTLQQFYTPPDYYVFCP